MYKKFLLGSVIVLALTTVAVSSAILLQVAELSGFLHTHGHTIPSLGGAVDSASAGSPQTILILGSDHRKQDTASDRPHSDTILLMRLDPGHPATTLMSIPRDLKVTIPGHGTNKINQAYYDGGAALTLKTVKRRSRPRASVRDQPRRRHQLPRVPPRGRLRGLRVRRGGPALLQPGRDRATRRSTSSPATSGCAARTRSTTCATATATTTSSAARASRTSCARPRRRSGPSRSSRSATAC